MTYDILIVGSGAREHAIAWRLAASARIDRLYVAPGNAGTEALAENVPIAVTDVAGIARFVEERDIALTVIGPEAPLPLGLADRLRTAGRRVVGPDAAAARLETSKSFAKEMMTRAGVPTARYAVFDDPIEARRFTEAQQYPIAVKADGLAAGKGVWICRDAAEAEAAIDALMIRRLYGAAGERVVIEEGLVGPEVSLIAVVDGTRVVPFPLAQDHKRLLAGDRGPNTGGMGAYAPVPSIAEAEVAALARLTIEPVVAECAAMGMPYRGILFAGLMLTANGPYVLEYNCRLGDPEAQVLLPLLDEDLLPWLEAVAEGTLQGRPRLRAERAVGVVLAAPGYPDRPVTGAPIAGLDQVPDDLLIFHAGTTRDASGVVRTAGGRVLTVVGRGETIDGAAKRAYAAPVQFEGMQWRDDIGRRADPHPPAPSPVCGQARGRRDGQHRSEIPPHRPPTEFPLACGRERGLGGEGANTKRIGVLASGEGSNLQALIDACARGERQAEIALVVSQRIEAGALHRAYQAGIPAVAIPLTRLRDEKARAALEEGLLRLIDEYELDLLVLAGWMLILSGNFLARCPIPILNVHPALLPDGREPLDVPVLRGAHAVRDALALGLPYTGVSVHHVTEEVDAGPVVVREMVPIASGDDEESLYARIKPVEHRLLVGAVHRVLAARGDVGREGTGQWVAGPQR